VQTRFLDEQVIPTILASLPQSACSAEYRDHGAKVSVRLYKSDGSVLCTTEDMPLRVLREKNILNSRINRWKRLLSQSNA
jgi:hypothetical protein